MKVWARKAVRHKDHVGVVLHPRERSALIDYARERRVPVSRLVRELICRELERHERGRAA